MTFWQKMSDDDKNEIAKSNGGKSNMVRCDVSQSSTAGNIVIKRSFIGKNLWAVGVIVGVLFLGIGIYEEQLTDMYRKAVMICLECIGIG